MTAEQRTALVTGSSKNIGRAIAKRLAAKDIAVGVTARSDDAGCRETVTEIQEMGGTAAYALGDLGDADDITAVVESIRENLGPIDILVNNASIRPLQPTLDVTLEDWETVQRVNLRSMFLLAQQVLPSMIENGGGSIVNVAGISIVTGMSAKTHVVAIKSGIVGLTRGLALEFGRDGVRCNTLVLGMIDTSRDTENYKEFETKRERYESVAALGRVGKPEEVADACEFFVSDRSSFITGQTLHVNGGAFPISHILGET